MDLAQKIDISLTQLRDANETHQPSAFSTSLSAEDMVLLDLIERSELDVDVFTLDTGRLPYETYEVIDLARQKYNRGIRVLFPEPNDVETFVNLHGVNSFYGSKELRQMCCQIRKVKPLKRGLEGKQLWITGLRSAQSLVTRSNIETISWDATYGLYKLNPILDWSTSEVFEYIEKYSVPISGLYKQGYTSIGCAPCTRPIKAGESERAGRWWWEDLKNKECGLHVDAQGRLVRSSERDDGDESNKL